MKASHHNFHQQQRGAIMVISLLLLLIMTVLALGASQATRMQERMAGNARDHDLALQSAEAGLRAGERLIAAMAAAPTPCASGHCQVYDRDVPQNAAATPLAFRDNPWWTASGWPYDITAGIQGAAMAKQDPDYVIEELEEVPDALSIPPTGPPPSRMHYRVTSRGVGGTDASAVVIQSTWSRRF